VTVYEEAYYGREDAPILKMEEYRGSYQDNFTFSHPTPPELDVSAVVAEVLPQSLQLTELIEEQAADPECRGFAALRGTESQFDHNDAGLLVRRAPLDVVEQIVVPASLRPRLLHLEHFPVTA
jgi:hypothetical protein